MAHGVLGFARLAAAALCAALSGAAQGAPSWTETVIRAPVEQMFGSVEIEVTVLRPQGAGPFPIVVLSHGSPRTPQERRTNGRVRFVSQSQPFLAMGYAVIVPTRRGYGASGGNWAEDYGACSNPDYYSAGLQTAKDVRAALDAVRHESWVDATRVVLAGHSAGGFGSIAASSQPLEGLVAVVNFAGGRGSQSPDQVCGEGRLLDAMSRYGKGARVPSLWIYSENDRFFGPSVARRMHQAFVAGGGSAEFVQVPAFGTDGHAYFLRAADQWAPRVQAFLAPFGAAR